MALSPTHTNLGAARLLLGTWIGMKIHVGAILSINLQLINMHSVRALLNKILEFILLSNVITCHAVINFSFLWIILLFINLTSHISSYRNPNYMDRILKRSRLMLPNPQKSPLLILMMKSDWLLMIIRSIIMALWWFNVFSFFLFFGWLKEIFWALSTNTKWYHNFRRILYFLRANYASHHQQSLCFTPWISTCIYLHWYLFDTECIMGFHNKLILDECLHFWGVWFAVIFSFYYLILCTIEIYYYRKLNSSLVVCI